MDYTITTCFLIEEDNEQYALLIEDEETNETLISAVATLIDDSPSISELESALDIYEIIYELHKLT